jgi:hypothetical protein
VSLLLYGLVEGDSNLIRYVGCSKNGMRRPAKHLQPGTKPDYHVYRWIAAERARGVEPQIVVVSDQFETVEEMHTAEVHLIQLLTALGADLTNSVRTKRLPAESSTWRQSLSTATSNLWRDPEFRAQQTAARKEAWKLRRSKGPMSASQRAKIAATLTGRSGSPHTPETIERLRQNALARGVDKRRQKVVGLLNRSFYAARYY